MAHFNADRNETFLILELLFVFIPDISTYGVGFVIVPVIDNIYGKKKPHPVIKRCTLSGKIQVFSYSQACNTDKIAIHLIRQGAAPPTA